MLSENILSHPQPRKRSFRLYEVDLSLRVIIEFKC